MKSLYIIAFLALSVSIYAQQDKKVSETQEDPSYKQAKELEAGLMKEAQERAKQKPLNTLASEQGLEVKKQPPKQGTAESNSGKLLPNTATLQEVLTTIPGRQSHRSSNSKNTNYHVQGLPSTSTLTLEEIKKTIPKN